METPLEAAEALSQQHNNRILLKREDQQPVFSFKIRGAYNKIAQLSLAEREQGLLLHLPVIMPRALPLRQAAWACQL